MEGSVGGPGLELGVELGGDEIGMIIEFHHLTPTSALILPGESHPRLLDDAHSVRIHLVSVSMALIDGFGTTIELTKHTPLGLEDRSPGPEAHRPTEVRRGDLRHEHDAGLAVASSNSVEFASSQPSTDRQNSITAIWSPKQMPR